ncbi:hypothetical protein RND81_09G221700 [Saponaria officinalis]|uniref:No apical meristem-associated C-terminal domain-containing protein n=1 Tax=Saponaria officinalis TaxID=3572 RepID=A0AAW1IPS2_SAPOF
MDPYETQMLEILRKVRDENLIPRVIESNPQNVSHPREYGQNISTTPQYGPNQSYNPSPQNDQNYSNYQKSYPQFSSQMPSNDNSLDYNLSQPSKYDEDNEVEQNHDVQRVTQPPKQPSRQPARQTIQEDTALISYFMRHSTDNIFGTNQKKNALWVKVKVLFDLAREANPNLMPKKRNPGMLGGRFRRISAGVMKWVGCYEEVQRRKSSGMNEEYVIQEAHKLHNETDGKFQFEHAWLLLKKHKKWQEVVGRYVDENIGASANKKSGKTMSVNVNEYSDPETPIFGSDPDSAGSGKRLRVNEDGLFTPTSGDDEEGMGSQRPRGIKAPKKNKGKKKIGEIAYLAESIDRFADSFGEKKTADAELQ